MGPLENTLRVVCGKKERLSETQARVSRMLILRKGTFITITCAPEHNTGLENSQPIRVNPANLVNPVYRLPCAILTASGSCLKRNIAITPRKGPGARIINAYRHVYSATAFGISSIEMVVSKNPMHI